MTAGDMEDLHAPAAAGRAKRAWRWLGGFLAVLVLLTHVPSPLPHGKEPQHWDKLVHFGLYATLAGLALRALTLRARAASALARCILVLICVVAFGLLDEATQPLTGRDFDWFDWLADGIGALTGILGYEILRIRKIA